MIFYNIGHTNEIDIIGHYPQTKETVSSSYHIDNFNSIEKVSPNAFPDFTPKYGLDLHKESNETDILDRGALEFGFILSEKLKFLLERFNLPPHRFYPIDVYNAKNQYYWLHYITDFEQFFDVRNTEVEIFDIFKLEVIENKIFNSFQELINFNRNLVLQMGKTMRYKSISLHSNFPKFDLFEVTGAKNFTLITKSLKDELENENITGLEYLEYNKIRFNI